MSSKADFFRERITDFEIKSETLKSRFNQFSLYRIGLFILFLVLAIVLLNLNLLGPLLLLGVTFIIAFGITVKKHNQIKKRSELCQKLLLLNKEEKNRLEFNFDGITDGHEFVDEKHVYSDDLDVFGRNSLFQLINRAGTFRGIQLLANWLKEPAGNNVIETRQRSIKELGSIVDWRQKVHAHASNATSKKENEELFFQWLSGEDSIRNKPFYRLLPYLVILISSVMIVGYFIEVVSFFAFLIPFILTGYFLFKIIDYSRKTYEMTQSGVLILESIENIVRLIEEKEFNYEYLLNLKSNLMPQNIVASEKIKELRKVFDWLSLRGNQIYLILNSIFLFDFILLAKAEKWRAAYKDEIAQWFDTIAEFEALNSLAAFSFANEEYAFPTIMEAPFIFRGKEIGHPLIPTKSRIDNEFSIEDQGTTGVITGSNMAGKSTFLRTIGINAILAFAGAPVCAKSLNISNFHVFTSMRTKDNLEENISSFYAELLRLKMLLEQINEEKPIMYFLDEILKGTNSVDRHVGAESLILQLNETNAFGLVSTHDLELGKLEKDNEKIKNYNFSSSIIGEEIVFDYKLREGICQSTNASQLMAKIGIQIKSNT